jgi:hypothetical protein
VAHTKDNVTLALASTSTFLLLLLPASAKLMNLTIKAADECTIILSGGAWGGEVE